jgi:hypothetical protein
MRAPTKYALLLMADVTPRPIPDGPAEKVWVQTHWKPASDPDAERWNGMPGPSPNLRLHTTSCQNLRPNTNRPYVGRRKATEQELKTNPRCQVC